LLTTIKPRNRVFERNAYSQGSLKLCSGKFLTEQIIKLQYGFLVSWIEEEQRIKYILSNISEDFLSCM